MSLPIIRALHGAPHRARVSRYELPTGDRITSVGRAGTGYVLEGSVTLEGAQGTESFSVGDVFERDAGNIVITADGDAVVVWAWPLPDELHSDPDDAS